MNPLKAFLFLLSVITFFLLILFFNEYRTEKTMVREEMVDSIDISPALIDSVLVEEITEDSLQLADSVVFSDAKPGVISGEVQLFNPQPFIYSGDDSLHFSYLTNKLNDSVAQKLPVRIIYFGDSQIENDRITSSMRKVLQSRFGGKGAGFVPLDQVYNPAHQFMLELSKNWEMKSFQDEGYVNSSLLFRNGLLNKEGEKAWVRIKRIQSLHPKPDFELMKIYYLLNDSCRLMITNSRETIYEGSLPGSEGVGVLDLQFNRTPDDVKLNFTNGGKLNVLGISLESKAGILVDNIALRGLSYPTFEWSNQMHIRQMIDRLNPGLFVLHFGVNLVPYQSEDYLYFRKHFKRQILFLKDNYPAVPILIVGVSDMAKKENGTFVSYANIDQIKAIQKQVARETQSVFWDLEAFMGGSGGMIRWVNANPELGRKDYTHFSKEGAEQIGEQLAKMILLECKNDSITAE